MADTEFFIDPEYSREEAALIAERAPVHRRASDVQLYLPQDGTGLQLAPRLTYRQKGALMRAVSHRGQRKLLIVEIEFLRRYGHLSRLVVYAGAGPGDHIAILIDLFPGHEFHLYDPDPIRVPEQPGRARVYRQYFEDADADRWRSESPLFISDIRGRPEGASRVQGPKGDPRFETQVGDDMEAQRGWIEIGQFPVSMVKFRLPYEAATVEYLGGELLIQPWATMSATETRLITDGTTVMTYDSDAYNNHMHEHNVVEREWIWYDHQIRAPGLDHNYDCAAEIAILQAYLLSKDPIPWETGEGMQIAPIVGDLVAHISRRLEKGTLVDPPFGLYVDRPMTDKREQLYLQFREDYFQKRAERRGRQKRQHKRREKRK